MKWILVWCIAQGHWSMCSPDTWIPENVCGVNASFSSYEKMEDYYWQHLNTTNIYNVKIYKQPNRIPVDTTFVFSVEIKTIK